MLDEQWMSFIRVLARFHTSILFQIHHSRYSVSKINRDSHRGVSNLYSSQSLKKISFIASNASFPGVEGISKLPISNPYFVRNISRSEA